MSSGGSKSQDYLVQSVIFKKSKYSLEDAKKWLRENKYKYKGVDEKKVFWRFRQLNPMTVKRKGFSHYITKPLDNSGVELIIVYKEPIKGSGNLTQIKKDLFKDFKEGEKIYGGKLKADEIKSFVNESYEKDPKSNLGEWILDKELSNDNAKVYYNPNTGEAVVTHRGTQGASDWGNNAAYALGAYKFTDRYKQGKKVQDKTEKKYGKKNISTVGHSQGAILARELGGDTKEIINVNPAYSFEKPKKNEYNIRSENDVVSSAYAPVAKVRETLFPEYSKKHDIKIPSESVTDVLGNHSADVLDKLGDKEIGVGAGRKSKKAKEAIEFIIEEDEPKPKPKLSELKKEVLKHAGLGEFKKADVINYIEKNNLVIEEMPAGNKKKEQREKFAMTSEDLLSQSQREKERKDKKKEQRARFAMVSEDLLSQKQREQEQKEKEKMNEEAATFLMEEEDINRAKKKKPKEISGAQLRYNTIKAEQDRQQQASIDRKKARKKKTLKGDIKIEDESAPVVSVPQAAVHQLDTELKSQSQPKYWISEMECHFNAAYNEAILKQGAKWRMGILWVKQPKGKSAVAYQGRDKDFTKKYPNPADISVKDFHPGAGHSWIELPNGDIVDWALNALEEEPLTGRKVWNLRELNDKAAEIDMGIYYTPYKHEKKIREKVTKEYRLSDEYTLKEMKSQSKYGRYKWYAMKQNGMVDSDDDVCKL